MSARRSAMVVVGLALAAMEFANPAPSTAAVTAAPNGSVGALPEIVAGAPASPGQYPFTVAMLVDPGDFDPGDGVPLIDLICAGSLISPDTVVTAAHCLTEQTAAGLALIPPRRLTIAAGDVNLNVGFAGERLAVRRVRLHPDYDPATLAADVAVLQLADDAAEAPVALVAPGQEDVWSAGATATVMGWGFQGNGRPQSDVLLAARTPIIGDRECDTAYGSDYQSATMVCAGDLATGSAACDGNQGEDGGPLIVDDHGSPLLVGLTSWSDYCGVPLYPGVYARLAASRDFLEPYLDPDTAPDAPRRVSVVHHGGVAQVRWRPPSFDGGTAITGYRVTARPGPQAIVAAGTPRSVELTGLASGRHTISVRALNVVGTGPARSVTVQVP